MNALDVMLPVQSRVQEEALFLAGERVKPGVYRNIVTRSEIVIAEEDYLPATCDGQVACYAIALHLLPTDSPMPASDEPGNLERTSNDRRAESASNTRSIENS